jgi:hypothetical protein
MAPPLVADGDRDDDFRFARRDLAAPERLAHQRAVPQPARQPGLLLGRACR